MELASFAHYHVNGEQILTGKPEVCVVIDSSLIINKQKLIMKKTFQITFSFKL